MSVQMLVDLPVYHHRVMEKSQSMAGPTERVPWPMRPPMQPSVQRPFGATNKTASVMRLRFEVTLVRSQSDGIPRARWLTDGCIHPTRTHSLESESAYDHNMEWVILVIVRLKAVGEQDEIDKGAAYVLDLDLKMPIMPANG